MKRHHVSRRNLLAAFLAMLFGWLWPAGQRVGAAGAAFRLPSDYVRRPRRTRTTFVYDAQNRLVVVHDGPPIDEEPPDGSHWLPQ